MLNEEEYKIKKKRKKWTGRERLVRESKSESKSYDKGRENQKSENIKTK